MKSVLLILFLMSSLSYGDVIKNAVLDIECSSEKDTESVRITSDATGSSLYVGDTLIHESSRQLMGGTEGGDPYAQYVEGGYNITIFGGSFLQAFSEEKTFLKGAMSAIVWHQSAGDYQAKCSGVVGFDAYSPAFN